MTQWLAGTLIVTAIMSTISIALIGLAEGITGLRRPFRIEIGDNPEWVKLWLAHGILAVARFVLPGALIGLVIVGAV